MTTAPAPAGAPLAVPDRLYQEIAFIAYHLHWSYETLLDLDHGERRRWCGEISRINAQMNEGAGAGASAMPTMLGV